VKNGNKKMIKINRDSIVFFIKFILITFGKLRHFDINVPKIILNGYKYGLTVFFCR